MQTGLCLIEAVCGILSSNYGLYSEWRQANVALGNGLTDSDIPRPNAWDFEMNVH
jgi:hypothetical protein